ncbi:hypothetical protein PCIT_a4096 [Pseudoalteromonas citrea]|uniref:SIMPL domain-containing protein n=2 Tax=Pseudoalteromonas citrea TaxID=43655 RepID=A0AAD4AIQ4_9GAMM|nr:SIMPL domain-containing protein [Pseudoalteromonas citrea]KAF7771503.1 hypothetical protein PCIT_a4096 [Pseudoalteromonas citrea]
MKIRSVLLTAALLSAQSFASSLPSEPHLYVQGNAHMQVQPDRAVIRVAITEKSKSLSEAKKRLDDIMANAISIAKNHKIKSDNIHAEQLNVYRQTRYNRTTNQDEFEGFRVSRSLTLKLEQIESYPVLLQKLVDAGINEFNNTQFEVSNKSALMKSLNKVAIKDAKLAAKELASDFDVKLDGLYSVSFSPMETPRAPYARAESMKVMSSDSGSVENAYNTGALTLKAHVYAVYTISN